MSTQLTPINSQCDALYLSRSVVRTAIISLITMAALVLTIFYLLHSRSTTASRQAGATHFSTQPSYRLLHQQLGYVSPATLGGRR